MYTVTPLRVLAVLALYGLLYMVMRINRQPISAAEGKTFSTLGALWAVSVFIGNYLFYRAGIMSFLPWVTNFLHTFVWIGVCLTALYLTVRESTPLILQCVAFAAFSLIVKYAEQLLFGTWELDHFFHVLHGNVAYVLGWSVADGLYPPITFYGLRLLGRAVPGLVVL